MNAIKIAASAVMVAAAVFIVKGTKIGPTILVVSISRGWGVHAGDFLSFIPLAVAAVLLSKLKRNKTIR